MRTIVLILAGLLLLVLGLAALAQAGLLTIPVFDQIAQLINSLTVPGA